LIQIYCTSSYIENKNAMVLKAFNAGKNALCVCGAYLDMSEKVILNNMNDQKCGE
jgi:hypothetical protein